jgi:ubiquinone/menaquinone biosynthesis C-methylase UbiE
MAWFHRGVTSASMTDDPAISDKLRALGISTPADASVIASSSGSQEIGRRDFQHRLLRQALRGAYAAPIGEPAAILDVGCGTGRWALEMAERFPHAHVTGVDHAPSAALAAPHGARSANLAFVAAGVWDGLPFADAAFDFVHMRLLLGALPAARWPGVARELVRVTRLGGWIELMEGDLSRAGGPAQEVLNDWIIRAGLPRGVDPRLGARVGDLLRNAGLSDVETRELTLPIGEAGGRVGAMMAVEFQAGVETLRAEIVTRGIATPREIDQVVAAMTFEMTRWQYVQPFHLAFGQR